jgi:hypothetical protein
LTGTMRGRQYIMLAVTVRVTTTDARSGSIRSLHILQKLRRACDMLSKSVRARALGLERSSRLFKLRAEVHVLLLLPLTERKTTRVHVVVDVWYVHGLTTIAIIAHDVGDVAVTRLLAEQGRRRHSSRAWKFTNS